MNTNARSGMPWSEEETLALKEGRLSDINRSLIAIYKRSSKLGVKLWSFKIKGPPTRSCPEYNKEYYRKNRVKCDDNSRNYTKRLREEMIRQYGSECAHCGENDIDVLVLDHIFDDAPKDWKRLGSRTPRNLYLDLRNRGWPKDRYQILCHNCNYRKELKRRRDALEIRKASKGNVGDSSWMETKGQGQKYPC